MRDDQYIYIYTWATRLGECLIGVVLPSRSQFQPNKLYSETHPAINIVNIALPRYLSPILSTEGGRGVLTGGSP